MVTRRPECPIIQLTDAGDVKVDFFTSGEEPSRAWQLESFLVKNFEYGNYSFRKALTGQLSNQLRCLFYAAEKDEQIIAAAGSLFSTANPAVALFGPVCVAPEYRRRGLGRAMCELLINHLISNGVQALYLGVRQDNPATRLYRQLGFEHLSGIVMRKMLVEKSGFWNRYQPGQTTRIKDMTWDRYPEVSSLLCQRASMHTFDFTQHAFSVGYTDIHRFLPVFPTIISRAGAGRCLQTDQNGAVVGVAHIHTLPSPQEHVSLLDFFVLDAFAQSAAPLVETTLNSRTGSDTTTMCCCVKSDLLKIDILKSIGAASCASLPGLVQTAGRLDDLLIFRL